MRSIKLSSFAGSAVLLGALCSQAFAWSISGIVQDKNTGAPLAGVSVATFNYAGFATTSAADGSFSLNNEGTESLLASQPASMAATLENGIFTLSNVNAHQLKISAIDALGKVTYQRSFYEINGSVSINLAKATGHRAKFLRVSKDGSSQTYMMQGKSILLKEGEPLPMLNFAKAGYNSGFYQMKQETETNVVVKLSVNDGTSNSSSSVTKPSSSSSKAKSSSSKDSTPVDCTGKSYAAGDHNMSVNVTSPFPWSLTTTPLADLAQASSVERLTRTTRTPKESSRFTPMAPANRVEWVMVGTLVRAVPMTTTLHSPAK